MSLKLIHIHSLRQHIIVYLFHPSLGREEMINSYPPNVRSKGKLAKIIFLTQTLGSSKSSHKPLNCSSRRYRSYHVQSTLHGGAVQAAGDPQQGSTQVPIPRPRSRLHHAPQWDQHEQAVRSHDDGLQVAGLLSRTPSRDGPHHTQPPWRCESSRLLLLYPQATRHCLLPLHQGTKPTNSTSAHILWSILYISGKKNRHKSYFSINTCNQPRQLWHCYISIAEGRKLLFISYEPRGYLAWKLLNLNISYYSADVMGGYQITFTFPMHGDRSNFDNLKYFITLFTLTVPVEGLMKWISA